MNKKKFFKTPWLLAILTSALLYAGCKDKDNNGSPIGSKPKDSTITQQPDSVVELSKLPAMTSEGKCTFGCLIDGKAYVSKSYNPSTCNGTRVDYPEGDYINFSGDNDTGKILGVHLSISKFYTPDITDYELGNSSDTTSWGYIGLEKPNTNGNLTISYSTDSTRIGKLKIYRGSRGNGYFNFWGTFNFDAVDPETGNVIKIRHGRFDVKN